MHFNISENSEGLSERVASWMVDHIKTVLQNQDRFTICLSGGNTPKKLYQLLSSEKYRDKINWSKLHVFWGDERFVPFDDDRNNAKMAFDALLDQVPVPLAQIHKIRTDIPPEQAAKQYEKILQQYFSALTSDYRLSTFDLILLGLGDNAHTLSLFPGYDLVHEKEHWVRSFFLKEQDEYRITLTAPVVNQSARIAFLVTGKDKAEAVERVVEGGYDPDRYPARIIQPINGELYWFLDESAAAKLKK